MPEAALRAFQESYASTAYRCRFPDCSKPFAGFASSSLRAQHERLHFRRVYCHVEACRWNKIGFKNRSGLDAHLRKHHDEKSMFLVPSKVRRNQEQLEPSEPPAQQAQFADINQPFVPFGSIGDEVSLYPPSLIHSLI